MSFGDLHFLDQVNKFYQGMTLMENKSGYVTFFHKGHLLPCALERHERMVIALLVFLLSLLLLFKSDKGVSKSSCEVHVRLRCCFEGA